MLRRGVASTLYYVGCSFGAPKYFSLGQIRFDPWLLTAKTLRATKQHNHLWLCSISCSSQQHTYTMSLFFWDRKKVTHKVQTLDFQMLEPFSLSLSLSLLFADFDNLLSCSVISACWKIISQRQVYSLVVTIWHWMWHWMHKRCRLNAHHHH